MKKRKDGRYKRTFTFNGRQHSVYGHSKQELDRKEHEKRLLLESNKESRDNPTLDQYNDRWIKFHEKEVKANTIYSENSIYRRISEAPVDGTGQRFGGLKLKDITTDDVRELQTYLHDVKGLSTSGVNQTLSYLSTVMKNAVNEQRISFNPCKPVKALKRSEVKARDTGHRALSRDEVKAFFEIAENDYYYDLFCFALNTGMRAGEIGALTIADIHDGFIYISRTITLDANGGHIIGESPKTEHGRRKIPLNETIRGILEHQRQINEMLHGNVVRIDGVIFSAIKGGLINEAYIDKTMRRICIKAGIEPFTMHAFRTTFATRCIEAGVNPKTLQDILGHANFNLTMSLYGHTMDDSMVDAMYKVQSLTSIV